MIKFNSIFYFQLVYEIMKNWASNGENFLLKDATEKMFNLNKKLNDDCELERKITIVQEIILTFRRFKENDVNLKKLNKKIVS
jgi:hypothetical protein